MAGKNYYEPQAVEAVAKENWNKDAALRAEFLGDFKLYSSFVKGIAAGAKIYSGAGARQGER